MRRLSVLLLVPFLLVGAACGDDDDSTASSSGGSTSIASSDGDGGDFCTQAAAFDQEIDELDKSFTGSAVPSSDVFKKTAASINDLADDAPDEIKDDLETIADGVEKIGDALSGIDLTDTAALTDPANAEKLQQITDEMQSIGEDVEAASVRVGDYLRDECGIDMDGEDTTTTSG